MDFLGDVMDAVGGGAGAVLGPVVQAMAGPALSEAAERAAELAVEKMMDKYPALRDLGDLMEPALDAAHNAAMELLQQIEDWCEEFSNDPVEAFHAVGVLILRACRAAVKAACEACLSMIKGCMDMFFPCMSEFDITDLVDEVAWAVQELMKEWLRRAIESKGLPGFIIDMLDFAFSEDEDIGSPGGRRNDDYGDDSGDDYGDYQDGGGESEEPQEESQEEEPQEEEGDSEESEEE